MTENTREHSRKFHSELRDYAPKTDTPTFKETLQTIWRTPNLLLISSTNCLEWIDMFLFIHCASLFGSVFAPQWIQDEMAFIFTAILWIIPPVSSSILGMLSDQFGRRRPLMVTASAVIILTAFLTITPTYSQAGMWAFSIFMSIRIIMSFVISGENILACAYAYESSARYEDTCLTIPLVDLGEIIAGIGILTLSSFLLSLGGFVSDEYIVRILLISLLCCYTILIKNRNKLKESQDFLISRDMTEDPEIYRNTYVKLSTLLKAKENKNTLREWFCYIGTRIAYSVSFLISYVYSQEILSSTCGFSTVEIFRHNLFVLIGELITMIVFPFLFFHLENNNILSRKKTATIGVFLLPTCGSIIFYIYLSLNQNINPFIFGLLQISILCMFSSMMAGQFLNKFPTLGRVRLATLGWAASQFFVFLIGVLLIEKIKAHGGYEYFFVLWGALLIHIISIILSKEPTRDQKLLGFDCRWMLQKKQLEKKLGYEI